MGNGESVLRCLCEDPDETKFCNRASRQITELPSRPPCAPSPRLDCGIRAGGNPTRREHSRRGDASWEVRQNLVDLFAAQYRSVRTRTQNGKAGSGVNENTHFPRARASRCQHNAPTLYSCIQWVSGPKAKFAA